MQRSPFLVGCLLLGSACREPNPFYGRATGLAGDAAMVRDASGDSFQAVADAPSREGPVADVSPADVPGPSPDLRPAAMDVFLEVGPSPLPATVPRDGLVGYWSFDEGQGSRARDSSGNRNDGLLAPGATWAPGRVNGALSVTPPGRVVVPRSTTLDSITGSVTVAAWAWRSQRLSNFSIVVSRQVEASEEEHYGLGFLNDVPLMAVRGLEGVTAPAGTPIQTWVHLAGVYDGNQIRIYVDGRLVSTSALVGAYPQADVTDLMIGTNINVVGPIEDFDGRIDEVALYARALTDVEIAALAKP